MKLQSDVLALSIISLVSTVTFLDFGLLSRAIFYESSVFIESIVIFMPAIVFPFVLSFYNPRIKTLQFYLSLIVMSYYALFFISALWVPNIVVFPIISLMINGYIFVRHFYSGRISVYKIAVFYSVVFIMFYLSGLLRFYFSPTLSPPVYVGSIYDDESPAGVPAFFAGALVAYTRLFVLTVSYQALLLFTGLAAILTENYTLIFRHVRNNAAGSSVSGSLTGALSILSCQCEGITAAFPTAVTLLISIAIIPLILESIVLLALTNAFLIFFYIRGRRIRLVRFERLYHRNVLVYLISTIFLISVPFIETVGIYLGLVRNLFFFVSIDIIMFIEGIVLAMIISRVIQFSSISRPFLVGLTILSFGMMFAWFVPALTVYAYSYYYWFAFMTLTSVLSGIITGYVYETMQHKEKQVYMEFITMMFSMFAIILFYLTVEGDLILWKGLSGLAGQATLSIAIWVVALPVMWIATNVSLNSYGVNNDSPALV
jgi:hypothetical protein